MEIQRSNLENNLSNHEFSQSQSVQITIISFCVWASKLVNFLILYVIKSISIFIIVNYKTNSLNNSRPEQDRAILRALFYRQFLPKNRLKHFPRPHSQPLSSYWLKPHHKINATVPQNPKVFWQLGRHDRLGTKKAPGT